MVDVVGVSLALVGALGIAGQSICVRIGTDEGHANDALLLVLLVNLVLIVPIAVVVSYPDYHLSAISIIAFVCAGTVSVMLGRVCLFAGIERIGASRAEALKASMPLHSTVLAVLILGEVLTLQRLLGVVLVVGGIALVSIESSRSGPSTADVPVRWLLLPLAAAVLFGFEPIFANIGFAEGTSYLVGLSIKITAAAVTFSGYLLWRGQVPSVDHMGGNLRWYLAGGIMGSISMVGYYAALHRAPVAVVVPLVQLSPLFVALVAVFFLQHLERVTPRFVASAMVVVLGAVIVTLAS